MVSLRSADYVGYYVIIGGMSSGHLLDAWPTVLRRLRRELLLDLRDRRLERGQPVASRDPGKRQQRVLVLHERDPLAEEVLEDLARGEPDRACGLLQALAAAVEVRRVLQAKPSAVPH